MQVMLHRTHGREGSELFDEIGLLVSWDKFSGQRVSGGSYSNGYAPVQNSDDCKKPLQTTSEQ